MFDNSTVHETPRVQLSFTMQLIAWAVGLAMVYGAVNARVSVLESKAEAGEHRLQSIEGKIDTLLLRK